MPDIETTLHGAVDLAKLTRPVMRIARDMAEKERRRLTRSANKTHKALLPIEDESEERFIREDAYDRAYCALEYYEDVYSRLPTLGIPVTPGNEILADLSRRCLNVNPVFGMRHIVDAYNDQHDIGTRCVYCNKIIPPTSKRGRSKKYCSASCRQRAYRQRK